MDYIEDNINLAVNFVYPTDEEESLVTSPEINDFIIRLSVNLIKYRKPQNMLIALLYATNYDLRDTLHCENTLSAIARVLHMSEPGFRKLVIKVKKDFGIKYTNKKYCLKKSIINNLKKKCHKTL